MKWSRSNWFLCVLGLSFALLSTFAGALGWYIQQITVSALFFLGGAYCANESYSGYKTFIIILPFLLIYGLTAAYSQAYNVLPILLSCPISAIIGGYYYNSSSLKIRIKGLLVIFSFILLNQSIIFPNWLVFTLNKPQIDSSLLPGFAMLNENRDTVWSGSWKGNIVILDFWSTACAPCIEKFPELEKVKKVYSHYKNVKIYSVNLPLKRDNLQVLDKILNNYTFETLYAIDSDNLKKGLGIEGIPYIIVIDSSGVIRYRGGLYTDWNIFIGNIYHQIDRLLSH